MYTPKHQPAYSLSFDPPSFLHNPQQCTFGNPPHPQLSTILQAPVNAVLLACVPTNLRNFSMSYNVLLIHLLGDTPSPYIVGQVSDWLKPHVGDHCLHAALIICYLWNLSSIAFYWAAWSTYGKGGRPRYSQGE